MLSLVGGAIRLFSKEHRLFKASSMGCFYPCKQHLEGNLLEPCSVFAGVGEAVLCCVALGGARAPQHRPPLQRKTAL